MNSKGPSPTEHRDQLNSDLELFWDFLSDSSLSSSAAQIRIRKSNVHELWHDFQEVQSRLEAEEVENITEHFRVRADFEELYFKCLAEAEKRLARLEANSRGDVSPTPHALGVRGVAAGASSDEGDNDDDVEAAGNGNSLRTTSV